MSADESLETRLAQLRDDGYCIFDQIIAPADCPTLADRLLAVNAQYQREQPAADSDGFVPGVINHEQSFAPYLADERLLATVERLVGPSPRISYTSAIINMPHTERLRWHADWPFNQNNAGHVPVPYPDIMHLTLLIMVSPFTEANGGTLILPGSHRRPSNPTDPMLGIDPSAPLEGELRVTGPAGSAVMFDARTWHSAPANPSDAPRVALGLRYAPWWLNLETLDPDAPYRRQLMQATGQTDNTVPRLPQHAFDALPEKVKPLYLHWVQR